MAHLLVACRKRGYQAAIFHRSTINHNEVYQVPPPPGAPPLRRTREEHEPHEAKLLISMSLWVDRHLHKNGGSTMREVMLRNEEAGNCIYYGYTQTREGWDRLMHELFQINGSTSNLPRLCVEAHGTCAACVRMCVCARVCFDPLSLSLLLAGCLGTSFSLSHSHALYLSPFRAAASQASAEFVSQRIPKMIALRAHFARLAVPMRVVLTTRVREPLSYYMSFYRWRVAGMQAHGNVIRLSSVRSVVQPIGTTFADWAPRNLQSIGLLHGDVELFAGLKAGGYPGVRAPGRTPHPYWTRHERFERAHYKLLLETLRQYDVVAPLDAFDEHLLLVAEAAGVPPLQAMKGVVLNNSQICSDQARCRAHIEEIAPWDVKLYRHVSLAFKRRLLKLGEEFASRLASFRGARARDDGICEVRSTCCCTERLPCFNLTGHERKYRVPPKCVPGSRRVQQLVSSDMPLGWCCTNRAPQLPRKKEPRGRRAGHRRHGRGRAARPRTPRRGSGGVRHHE
jgi:hypothetical protein